MKLAEHSKAKLVFRSSPSFLISWAVLAGVISCWVIIYLTIGSLLVKLLCTLGSIILSLRFFEHWRELTFDKLSGNLIYKDETVFQKYISPGNCAVVKLNDVRKTSIDVHNDKILFYCKKNKYILADFSQDRGLLASYDSLIRSFLNISNSKIEEVDETTKSDLLGNDVSFIETEEIKAIPIDELSGIKTSEIIGGNVLLDLSEADFCFEKKEKNDLEGIEKSIGEATGNEASFEKVVKKIDDDGTETIECFNDSKIKSFNNYENETENKSKSDAGKEVDSKEKLTIIDDENEKTTKDESEKDIQTVETFANSKVDNFGDNGTTGDSSDDKSSLSSLPTLSSYSIIDMASSAGEESVGAKVEVLPKAEKLAEAEKLSKIKKYSKSGEKDEAATSVDAVKAVGVSGLSGDKAVNNICTENVQNLIEKVKSTEIVGSPKTQQGEDYQDAAVNEKKEVKGGEKLEKSVKKVEASVDKNLKALDENFKMTAQKNDSNVKERNDKVDCGGPSKDEATEVQDVPAAAAKTNAIKEVSSEFKAKVCVKETEESSVDKKEETDASPNVPIKSENKATDGSFEEDFELISKEELEESTKTAVLEGCLDGLYQSLSDQS